MIFAGLVVIASLGANQGVDPARLMLLDGSSCRMSISANALSTEPADLARNDEDRKKALSDLAALAPEAIKSAGGSATLENAIKEFYSAADTYCKKPSSAGAEKLNDTENALDKLLDAAGR